MNGLRSRVVAACVLAAGLSATRAAQAQVIDRAKKAVQGAASAAADLAKSGSDKFDVTLQGLTSTPVADGAFAAVASPWVGADMHRIESAHFTGKAVAVSLGSSYLVILCADSTPRRWLAEMTLSTFDPRGVAVPIDSQFTIPDRAVAVIIGAQGLSPGGMPTGVLKVVATPQKSVDGTARLKLTRARFVGTQTADTVNVGITFKATVSDTRGAACNASRPAAPPPSAAPRPAPGAGAARPPVGSGGSFAEGDVLIPKIEGVKLLTDARDGAATAATLKKTDELVYLGEERGGYVHVQGTAAEGWVKKVLVGKR